MKFILSSYSNWLKIIYESINDNTKVNGMSVIKEFQFTHYFICRIHDYLVLRIECYSNCQLTVKL
jgi:hypothetical protein